MVTKTYNTVTLFTTLLHNLIMGQNGTNLAVRKHIKIVVKQQAQFLSQQNGTLIMENKKTLSEVILTYLQM